MTKAFDEATYRQDFEAINGRQPSEEELEHAKYLVDRYIVGKDDDSGVVTYHPIKRSLFKALLGSTFGWIRRGGVFLVMTPVFLTKLFFNLIGSTIGVFVIWLSLSSCLVLSLWELFFSVIRRLLMNLKKHQVYYEMLALSSLERGSLPTVCQTFSLILQ